MKYIGMDAHISSVSLCVRGEDNTILDESTLALDEKLIKEYIEGIEGEKKLTFEEGSLSAWLYMMLHEKVDRLIICNPVKNALVYKGNSNDVIDARKLAELLRLDALSEVKHPATKDRQELREVMNLYYKLRKEITRCKNRLKATFRMKGIACTGTTVYNEIHQRAWIAKLKAYSIAKESATILWRQLGLLQEEKAMVYKLLARRAKKFKEIAAFMEQPGVGLITGASFSAALFTPWRFANKAKVWGYCGLSLEENDTGKRIEREKEKVRQRKVLRRLTTDGNKRLKSELKGAVERAIFRSKENEFQRMYGELIARGLRSESAILTLTRRLANKLFGIWKELERKKTKRV